MSPRPAPTTDDDMADIFLRAGSRLIDALLATHVDELPPRLRSLHFPAPLGWIRVDDVIREARQAGAAVSPKAFRNRWPDKDSYLVDLATYAITHTEGGGDSAPETIALRGGLVENTVTFSARIETLTASVMAELLGNARSFLTGHLAAVLHHAPGLAAPLQASTDADNVGWSAFYEAAVRAAGLRWRPGWDADRAQVAVRALIEGMLICHRTAGRDAASADETIALFRDAATALVASIVDLDGDGRSVAQVLDEGVARAQRA